MFDQILVKNKFTKSSRVVQIESNICTDVIHEKSIIILGQETSHKLGKKALISLVDLHTNEVIGKS